MKITSKGSSVGVGSTIGVILLFVAGCGSEGPPRVAVHGAVRLGGAPLTSGVIRFVPVGETKGPSAVTTVRDGRYELSEGDGPIVGTHRVEIEAIDYFGFVIDDEAAYTNYALSHRGRLPPNPVPPLYRGSRSPLSADVSPDREVTLDFAVPSGRPVLASHRGF